MKNFKIYLILLILQSCVLDSTIDEKKLVPDEKTLENSKNWEVEKENNLYGYEDKNGFEITPKKYLEAEKFYNGVAIVKNDSGYFLINYLDEKISNFYSEIKTDRFKSKGNETFQYFGYKLENNKKLEVINSENTFIKPPPKIDEYIEKELDSICLIDNKGQQITPFYNEIRITKNQLYYIVENENITKNKRTTFLLNYDGEKISEGFDYIWDYKNALIVGYKHKKALLNYSGEVITDYYNDIKYLKERDVFIFDIGTGINFTNKKGLIDSKGNILIQPKYNEFTWNKNYNLYLTTKSVVGHTYNGLIDSNYKELIAPNQYISLSHGEYFGISSGEKYAYFIYENNEFKKISEDFDIFKKDYHVERTFLIFWKNTYSGTAYSIPEFYNGYSRVSKNNKFGFINEKLEIVVPLIYDMVEERFTDNKCLVELNGEKFYINKKGEKVEDYIE